MHMLPIYAAGQITFIGSNLVNTVRGVQGVQEVGFGLLVLLVLLELLVLLLRKCSIVRSSKVPRFLLLL
jgi:hypothetical protein